MSRNKKPRKPRQSKLLDNLMFETFSRQVHLSVALNARLAFQRLEREASTDAHNDIAEYVMIVGHAIQGIPQLQDEARQIEDAARSLDHVYDRLVEGIPVDDYHLVIILGGVNAIDRAVDSPYLKTARLYQAERQVEATLRKLQNKED